MRQREGQRMRNRQRKDERGRKGETGCVCERDRQMEEVRERDGE